MSVSFNYIPSNIRVPLFYAEVDNSMANTATADKKALLIALMNTGDSDATATLLKPTLVATAEAAKTKFGRGSPLALMAEAFRNQNTTMELWCIPVDCSTAVKASGAVQFKGTATESGTLYLYVGSSLVSVSVTAGTTAAEAVAGFIEAINSSGDLPVTAKESSSDEGTIELAAKVGGIFGNDIIISKNLQGDTGGESDVPGLNMIVAGALTGGAGEPDYEEAFKSVNTETYTFIGIQDNSATALDACKSEMNDSTGRWSYARMQYGHVFTTKRGDAETLVTFGKTRNDQHVTVFGIEPLMPEPTYVVTGAALGRIAGFIANDPARPCQTGELNDLMQTAIESRFNLSERNTLLHNAIATLYYNSGTVMIERVITTYRVNKWGDADNSYLDANTLFTLAEIITRLKSAITSKYPRHKLANDGTRYGAGQAIVTPKVIRSELVAQYASMERDGLVENADLFAKYLVVERNSSDVNRIDVLLPPDLVNQLRIFALQAQFRLQYSDND
jgi:phage tail sheath gpL-like